ncbi:MAG: ATP-binding protein [Candidatus Binatia bacterium]
MNTNELPFSLEDVVLNSELVYRPSRPANYEAENEALIALAQIMADSPELILQRLAETALDLCHADTAGISLLENHNGEEVFRWEALAGVYADRLNHLMPRNASPCGTTIDRNTTQLMYMAERFFPALKSEPPVVEALLIPFHVERQPIGTIWVVAHDERRKFDREDERIVKTLAQFASAGWQSWKARTTAESAAAVARQQSEALKAQVNESEKTKEKLQHLSRELEQNVYNQTRELDVAEHQLQEAHVLASLGTAAAKIVHDLVNPINSIFSLLQLQEIYLAESSERLHELITETTEDLKHETARVIALIGELREFSRPLRLNCEPMSLSELVVKFIREQAPFLHTHRKPVEVEQQLAEDLPLVAVDCEKFTRVLLNLCKNALDAMPEGGRLVLRCYPNEKHICLEIEDSGSGIPKNMNIFEPFVTSKPNGWGLGLANVQQIISAHNGTIAYSSEPGKGTIFTICLPIASIPRR